MQQVIKPRRLALLALYLTLLVGGWHVGMALMELAEIEVRPLNEPQVHLMILGTVAVFAVASALPFVPGAEIGFALMLIFGSRMALLVYLAMVTALLISYAIGRLVPLAVTAAMFRFLGLARAQALVERFRGLPPGERITLTLQSTPRRLVPFLVRHRYAALALLFNLPGNSLAGGGGGIALSAGVSRLFSFPAYLVTVLLAVAPVPAIFALVNWK